MSFSHSASSYHSGFKHSSSPMHSPFLRYFPMFKHRNVSIDCFPWINNAFIYLTSCQVIHQVKIKYYVIVCIIVAETSHNKLFFCLKITKDSCNSMLRLYICQRLVPLINVYQIPAEDQIIAWCLVLSGYSQQTVIVVGYALAVASASLVIYIYICSLKI